MIRLLSLWPTHPEILSGSLLLSLIWFFGSLPQYLKIDLFKDYASPSIYYISTNTDPNDKEAKQSKEFYESRLKMMQEGNYIEEEEENDAENGEENDEETGSELGKLRKGKLR